MVIDTDGEIIIDGEGGTIRNIELPAITYPQPIKHDIEIVELGRIINDTPRPRVVVEGKVVISLFIEGRYYDKDTLEFITYYRRMMEVWEVGYKMQALARWQGISPSMLWYNPNVVRVVDNVIIKIAHIVSKVVNAENPILKVNNVE